MAPDERRLRAFLLELGRALSLAGTAVSETQERLTRVAAANGAADARIIVLPTTLLIAVGWARETTVESVPQRTGALRLDQIGVLYGVVRDAERGDVGPERGLRRLAAMRRMRPRHRRPATVAWYAVMTAGLCLILQPTASDVVLAAVFGAMVGCLLPLRQGRDAVGILVPVLAATVVSALTFVAVRHRIADPGLRTLIAPLTTFLPGSVLTTATVELASGEMVAGASRLVFGALQLLLLAFGIVAGAELAGLPRADAVHDAAANLLGWWAPWLGVLVYGIGAAAYFSAPRGALRWLLLVLFTAWTGQRLGALVVGANVGGFLGALTMTPVALAVARLRGGPPSQVTFLPAFWLLVPGALGLIGVTQVVGDPGGAGLQSLVQPVVAIVAIALGVLCGTALDRSLGTALVRLRAAGNCRARRRRAG